MHTEITYILHLLGAFVRHETAPVPPADIDRTRLLALAKSSGLSGIVGYMLQVHPDRFDPETSQRFAREFFMTVGLFSNHTAACAALTGQLTDAGIPHAVLKGAALSCLYPAKELRTFGDIDIFIPPENRERLCALLAQNGERIVHEDDHQVCISRPPLLVEFHFSLTADAVDHLPALQAYLKDPVPHMVYWEPAGMYTVDPLYHFVYLLSHQMRHFESDSPGIRSYLDLAVFLQSGLAPDGKALARTLREVGLYDYAVTALTLTAHWFGVPSLLETVAIPPADIAFIEQYIFSVGQFAREQNPRARQVSKGGRLHALWESLFPPAAFMRQEKRYAKLADTCLPLAYMYRLFRGTFCRTSYAWTSAKAIAGATQDAAQRNRIRELLLGGIHP